MYCEVPPQVLPQFKQYLQEGNVLYISNVCVERAKPGYKAVDAPYMLKLIMRTQIFEGDSNDTSFPKYVFSLTPIEILPQYEGRIDRFLGNQNIHTVFLHFHFIYICLSKILSTFMISSSLMTCSPFLMQMSLEKSLPFQMQLSYATHLEN
jgi:hypothetical protein